MKLMSFVVNSARKVIGQTFVIIFGSFVQAQDSPYTQEFKRFPVVTMKKPDWGSHFCLQREYNSWANKPGLTHLSLV